MVHIKTLLPELRKLVGELANDLLNRVKTVIEIDTGLRAAFNTLQNRYEPESKPKVQQRKLIRDEKSVPTEPVAEIAERIEATADKVKKDQAFEVWREDYLDQVAVAWVLACVFVRFMEDNQLIDECWLAGEGERRRQAEDTHELFFREHPHDTDREYFHYVFHEVGKIPAAKDLFAEGKTPLWAVSPSGDAAMKLLNFWQEMDAETGHLKRSFQVESGDTRFLGDLYQELSERAKKKYALLQTPVFVEEFILDRTLTPALDEFGLEKVRMIDPTCGSGHFLLGAFDRLFRLWSRPEHTSGNAEKDAQKALDGIWGVDINPFAVAIARFRLIVAAVQACGTRRLKRAAGWKINLATGDSLLIGSRWNGDGTKRPEERYLDDSWAPAIYACEDQEAMKIVLGQQYHAVVGNPPYIAVDDPAVRGAVKKRYSTCHGAWTLSVPFIQRFVELTTCRGSLTHGYFGLINSNNFMNREFGKKLVEQFLPTIDVTHVIDTAGAKIPGHGTPTVILFGRHRKPTHGSIRTVQGIKGELSVASDPSLGNVWQSIVSHIDRVGSSNEWVSVQDIRREEYRKHPWCLAGGGESELKTRLEASTRLRLAAASKVIGSVALTREDDVFLRGRSSLQRCGIADNNIVPYVKGQDVRDYEIRFPVHALWPYDSRTLQVSRDTDGQIQRLLWPWRSLLSLRVAYGKTQLEHGLKWYEYSMLFRERCDGKFVITYAEVATHNHFVLERQYKVFKETAPIIKLPDDATEEDYVGLVGILNSSVAEFWLKKSCQNKGSTVDQDGARQRTQPFEDFYQRKGTRVGDFPVASGRPLATSRRIDELSLQSRCHKPDWLVGNTPFSGSTLRDAQSEASSIRAKMIALQEELDWECYHLYGLVDDEGVCFSEGNPPEVFLGQRAFEIVMARKMASGELETTWFQRHGSTPITDIPSHWPAAYRKVVERRLDEIETNREVCLVEKPEYKRRWNDESWDVREQCAIQTWLLDRLETPKYRKGTKDSPELTTTAQMADIASADAEFLRVAALYRDRPDFDVSALVTELVEAVAVPFLPVLRYKPTGLLKRAVWERVWDLQRQQDGGTSVADIPETPRYVTGDFQSTSFYRIRTKLDVPNERWVSYPHCSTDSDASLLVGWAGWNHLEQATALVAYYDARKREGWDAKRLTPLLAGLDQLLPWIHQWHPKIDAEFGETAGQSFQTMLESDAHELGLTLDDIRAWVPPAKAAGTKPRKARTPRKKKTEVEGQDD